MTKWIIALGVLIIIGVGLWWSGIVTNFMTNLQPSEQTATTTPQVATTPEPVSDLPTANNDTSNAALAQDSVAIDAQITSLAGDSTGIDASLNDKPVTQEF